MPREADARKETCRENKRPQEKDMPREREISIKKKPRLQEKEISRKRHAE
jgi:hypothetical protein